MRSPLSSSTDQLESSVTWPSSRPTTYINVHIHPYVPTTHQGFFMSIARRWKLRIARGIRVTPNQASSFLDYKFVDKRATTKSDPRRITCDKAPQKIPPLSHSDGAQRVSSAGLSLLSETRYDERLPVQARQASMSSSTLPGVGRKTALRLALHLLSRPPIDTHTFADALVDMRDGIVYCRQCYNISDTELCPICSSPQRDSTVCVVQHVGDVMAIEYESVPWCLPCPRSPSPY